MKNLDGDAMSIARRDLVGKIDRLGKCMRNYNATVGADDPENGSTDEDMALAEEAEVQAEKELPDDISTTLKAIDKLRDAFAADLQELRSKRQVYDQILATAALPKEG